MVRTVIRRAAFVLAVLLLAACQRNSKKTIAVVPKATSHLFWVSVQAGAMAAGEEFGVNVEWNGAASETEYPRQIQIVDSFISRRVDGIALAATERKALVGVLDRAAQANIPVTVFDSGVDSENYMSFLATNNYEGGQLAGRTLGRLLNGNGKVAVVMHAPGSGSTMDRERGFEDAIKAEFPGIRIVAQQFGQSDRSKAMAAMENILTAHPDLDGVFASSEPSSMGASLALKSRSLNGRVKLVAFDSSDVMIEDLKGGVIDAMVVQDPFRMGHDAVKTLVEKLNGQTPPKKIDLSARVVTKADLDKEDVKQLLFPDVKKYLKQ
ncbi:MAG: substrate-binding domain-containing protein [Acidobacteria bacterium]|nr:substrate-binding domain-containing protein [Acidobacteriota bacterium]